MAQRGMVLQAARPRTRIVCTLGPATFSEARIRSLLRAGMSVARLNLAHGDPKEHAAVVERVRSVAHRLGVPVGVLVDVPGPKYRIGVLPQGAIGLKRGQRLRLATGRRAGGGESPRAEPAGLHRDARAGDMVLVEDGLVRLRVLEVQREGLLVQVEEGRALRSGKGVTIPGVAPSLPYLTPETCEALRFAAAQRVDFVGLSCVRRPEDVEVARSFLKERDAAPDLVVKIERAEALDHLDAILELSDAVMVARGDLGVDVPLSRVPVIQRRIIQRCNQVGKPVITATQMLESMIRAPVPTRAEVSDIATAIFDHTDATMLSAETSVGRYPVGATRMMAEVARETETALAYGPMLEAREQGMGPAVDEAIAAEACRTAARIGASVIVAFTEHGTTAGRVSACRPQMPILALTPSERVLARLTLRWGVVTMQAPAPQTLEDIFTQGRDAALQSGLARRGDLIVLVAGLPIGVPGTTNLLRVLRA